MSTQRLYYSDSYITSFNAQVIERTTFQDAPAVILDQSFFYPTSGGQPHDIGILSSIPVVDVVVRETDGAVLHILGGTLTENRVEGQIDWERRFDHMRHHTGQHILSQAFIQVAQAETVGFHLGTDSVTIDLNRANIQPSQAEEAETLANQIVAENRPVRAYFPTGDELAHIDLRKVPEVDGKLRVVDIDGFDVTACGGTHVAHTGEIGTIKVLRYDRRGDTVRVEFRCGQRALLDYREKNALLNQLAAELTTSYREIPATLTKLREENKALQKEIRTLRATILEADAERLWNQADTGLGIALVMKAFEDCDPGEVRQLAQHLIAHENTAALLGIAGEKAQLIAACSENLPYDMVAVLKAGLATWNISRGGGRPSFAQGGGATAGSDAVQDALNTMLAVIREQHERG